MSLNLTSALFADARLELFAADELTPNWLAFSNHVAGIFVLTRTDPIGALKYVRELGMTKPILLGLDRSYWEERERMLRTGAMLCASLPVAADDMDHIVSSLGCVIHRSDQARRLLLDPISRTARMMERWCD